MEKIRVEIKRLAQDLPLPSYQTELAAAVDLHAAVKEDTVLLPGESKLIPTGIAMALPHGYEAQIRPRSGLAARNQISMVNTPGTIDADYRGEIKCILINHGKQEFVIKRGERIAQMVVNKVPRVEFAEVSVLSETKRGEGGFGSTSK